MKITLDIDDSTRRLIQKRAEEIRDEKVSNLERASWKEQAEILDSNLEELSEGEYLRYLVIRDLRESGYGPR